MTSHYKGKYRIKCEWDRATNQFPRKLDGTYEDIDCYIDCYKNIKIFHYGKSILEAYIPSLGRGRNIIKEIKKELDEGVIFNIVETDSEVLFQFKAVNMDMLEKYLKPKTNGSKISPFSSKNLPKNKKYKIPDEELQHYKLIVQKIGKNRILDISHRTKDYMKSLVTKNHTWDDIKADMALKGLSGKNYIHSIGKWSEYISYLEKMCS